MRLFVSLLFLTVLAPGPAQAAEPRRGDLLITEIAANPALPEPAAEFVVVDNVGSAPVLLDGVRLTDGVRAVRGVVGPGISLDAGQRIALQPAAGATAYSCSPLPYRALLSAWAGLNNAGDTVLLEAPDGAELNRVAYSRDAFAAEGPSLRLDRSSGRWGASYGAATPCAVSAPQPGRVQFTAATVTAPEHARTATLDLRRRGGTNGRLSVPWSTRDGSASAGFDYVASSGSVQIAAGQEDATIAVPLLDDGRDEPDESFTVVLGGSASAEPSRAVIRIGDDDVAPPPVAPPVVAPPVVAQPTRHPAAPVLPPPPAPRASLAVAGWQPVLRRAGAVAAVTCTSDCQVEVTGRIALGRGRFATLGRASRGLRGHAPATVLLPLPRRHVRAVRRALRRRGSLPLVVTAEVPGGDTVERRVRVR